MLYSEIKKRNVPPLKSQEEMLEIMLDMVYGHLPSRPEKMEFKLSDEGAINSCAGKATISKIIATVEINNKTFSFPFTASVPTTKGPHPFFVMINFRPNIPDKYLPVEEVIDNGFAVLSFCYEDISLDKDEYESGLAGILWNGKRSENDCGKISLWAWAAQRVMDWAETQEYLDASHATVCGHSRLGKTALLTAATDKRFFCAYSNDSGCVGAAITRGKQGETKEIITNAFPQWFSPKYLSMTNDANALPFDQHYLIASIAPRFVLVGSAHEDLWADPESEMLSCVAASPAFEQLGVKGFVHENRYARVGEAFFKGTIGYHLRRGKHFFCRDDWHRLIEFVKSK